MTTVTDADAQRLSRPRADALRNRERILAAAREMFVEYGPEAPLDEIARRAGIGNATLYRHFTDREALVHETVAYVMGRVADAAERTAEEETDAFVALRSFVHTAADERIGALTPLLSGALTPMFSGAFANKRADMVAEYKRLKTAVEGLMERARTAGRLREDVDLGDVLVALAQLTRPLPSKASVSMDRFIHRNVQVFLDGLERPARSELPGSACTLEDLRCEPDTPEPPTETTEPTTTCLRPSGRGRPPRHVG